MLKVHLYYSILASSFKLFECQINSKIIFKRGIGFRVALFYPLYKIPYHIYSHLIINRQVAFHLIYLLSLSGICLSCICLTIGPFSNLIWKLLARIMYRNAIVYIKLMDYVPLGKSNYWVQGAWRLWFISLLFSD